MKAGRSSTRTIPSPTSGSARSRARLSTRAGPRTSARASSTKQRCFDNVLRGTPAGFAETCEGFYRKCSTAARRIAVACALALELPSDDSRFFERNFQVVDQCTLQFLHFPPVDAADAVNDDDIATQLRVGEHTDFGMVTLLFHDSVVNGAGVTGEESGDRSSRRRRRGGEFDGAEWTEAPGRGGATACRQHGALMARWTNDEWRATAHRVVAGPPEVASRDRYSIAFFFDPIKTSIIATHPACLARTTEALAAHQREGFRDDEDHGDAEDGERGWGEGGVLSSKP